MASYNTLEFCDQTINSEINRFQKMTEQDSFTIKKVLNNIDIPMYGSILDVGCGPGFVSKMISDLQPKAYVYGIDLEQRYVDFGNDFLSDKMKLHFIQGNCNNLDFKNDSFDVTFSRYVFEHLDFPKVALNEMIRVTKPGGYICVVDWDCGFNIYHPKPLFMDKYDKCEQLFKLKYGGDRYFGRKIYKMFKGLNLKNVKVIIDSEVVDDKSREFFLECHKYFGHDEHPFVTEGLMTNEEINSYYSDLEKIIMNDDSFISYSKIVVIGRV